MRSLDVIAVFKNLPPEALAQVQQRCAWRHYQPRELIVDYLDPSNDVYFICEGEARVSLYSALGKAVTFCDLRTGDMFGEVAALDNAARSASIEALTDCIVASMSAAAFQELLLSEPTVTQSLLRNLVGKIRELTTRVYEFSVLAVSNRIQAELLRLAKLARREGKSATIAAMPTHAEIANRTSTHREAVTRELNQLARLGLIERRGHALLVKDVERLADIVNEATGDRI